MTSPNHLSNTGKTLLDIMSKFSLTAAEIIPKEKDTSFGASLCPFVVRFARKQNETIQLNMFSALAKDKISIAIIEADRDNVYVEFNAVEEGIAVVAHLFRVFERKLIADKGVRTALQTEYLRSVMCLAADVIDKTLKLDTGNEKQQDSVTMFWKTLKTMASDQGNKRLYLDAVNAEKRFFASPCQTMSGAINMVTAEIISDTSITDAIDTSFWTSL